MPLSFRLNHKLVCYIIMALYIWCTTNRTKRHVYVYNVHYDVLLYHDICASLTVQCMVICPINTRINVSLEHYISKTEIAQSIYVKDVCITGPYYLTNGTIDDTTIHLCDFGLCISSYFLYASLLIWWFICIPYIAFYGIWTTFYYA